MGLFDFLRQKPSQAAKELPTTKPPSREEFGRMMVDALQAANVEGLAYHESDFSIRIANKTSLYLGNAHEEYLAAKDDDARAAVLARFVNLEAVEQPSTPDDWEDARGSLLPAIRDWGFYASINDGLIKDEEKKIVWRPVAEWLGLAIAHDTPRTLNYVNRDLLSKWGVSFEEALTQACDNLLSRGIHPFKEVSPGFFRSTWEDCYDPARILVPESLRSLAIKEPVVAVPNWNTLLVADGTMPDALVALAQATEAGMQMPRNNNCPLLVSKEGRRTQFIVPPTHPAFNAVERTTKVALVRAYSELMAVMEKEFLEQGKNIFVPKLQAQQNEALQIRSFVVWSDGIPTLLPQVDRLALFDPSSKQLLGFAEWPDLAPLVAEMNSPLADNFPPLYLVSKFPAEVRRGEVPLSPKLF